MKKTFVWGAILWSLSAMAAAAVLQDWSNLDTQKDSGVFCDKNGSSVGVTLIEGPVKGQKAFRVTSDLKAWGGAWAVMKADLSHATAIRFQARAETPGLLQVALGDDQRARYVAMVRVLSDQWAEFCLPLSSFQPTLYPLPEAPKNASFHWSKVVEIQFQPETLGTTAFLIGPVSSAAGKLKAATGMPKNEPDSLTVQDFCLLEKNAYGPISDEHSGTEITMVLKKDPDEKGTSLADFRYDLKTNGWCGYWIRAGQLWGGQDWTGAKTLLFRVISREPITLQFGFNDANQNAYVATAPPTRGAGWEILTIPFKNFELNPYYQPPSSKKGAPQDLSHIESFNIAPQTQGEHEFKVGEVAILKK